MPPPPPRSQGSGGSDGTVGSDGGGRGRGLLLALGSYVLWGVLPLYFLALAPTGPFEIVAWRILLSLVFCALLLTLTRSWRRLRGLVRDRRLVLTLGVGGVFIYANWQIYVVASTSGHVVEASIGYFINPLVSVLLGVVLLRERLRPAQWVAVGLSAIAVVVITAGFGGFPWIAIALALSFGLYGFVKKTVGGRVDAVSGLTIETALLAPVAAVQLGVVAATGGLVFGRDGGLNATLILLAGVVTAVPLLLFAGAARRLPLALLGLTQYLTPVMQLLIGVLILHEPVGTERWIGLGLIWVGLVVLTVDSFVAARRGRADLERIVTITNG